MKNEFKRVHRLKSAAQGLLFGSSFLLCVSAGAQVNQLRNGDFESAPIGVGSPTTNWSVLYLKGCADDFEIKDRTRSASIRAAWYGAELRPRTQKPIHAAFTQTKTGLLKDHQYTVAGQMWSERAAYGDYVVYMEAIGGTGELLPDGRRSLLLTNTVDGTVYAKGVRTDNNAPSFEEYSGKQTPDASGNIEVRLHYWATTFRVYDKLWAEATYFDDITLYY
jgi:hypothetical protein